MRENLVQIHGGTVGCRECSAQARIAGDSALQATITWFTKHGTSMINCTNCVGDYALRGAYPKARFLLEKGMWCLCCKLCSSPIHMRLLKWQ